MAAGDAAVREQEGSARPPAGDSGPRRQWLADALKENDPSNVILFLVGSKKDLSVSVSPLPMGSLRPGWGGSSPPPAHPPGSVGRRRRSTA